MIVGGACHAVGIKIITNRDDKLRVKSDRCMSQFPCYVLLIIIAYTPKITQYQKAIAVFDIG